MNIQSRLAPNSNIQPYSSEYGNYRSEKSFRSPKGTVHFIKECRITMSADKVFRRLSVEQPHNCLSLVNRVLLVLESKTHMPYAVARQVPGQPGRLLAMTRPVTGQSISHDTTGPVSQFAMTRQGSHSLSGDMTGLQSNSYDAARQTVTHLNMKLSGSHSFHDDVASQSVTHVAMSRQGLDQSFNYDTTNQPVTQVNMTRQGDSQSFGNDGARLPVGYENISRPASRSFVNDATSQPIA